MAYSAPTTRSTGFLVTAAVWNQDVVNNVAFLANPPACRVYRTTTQSINDSTFTAIDFDAERYDTDSMHDNVTNKNRITINTAGLYLFTFTADFAAAADYSIVQGFIQISGATSICWEEKDCNARNDNKRFLMSAVYKMTAGQYVEAIVFQDNTANAARNISTAAATSPEFSATWIGLG